MSKTYKTYITLAEAFKSGELKKEEWILRLDNDDCFLSWIGDDEKEPKRQPKFNGNGYNDLQRVIEALGIPCEWV